MRNVIKFSINRPTRTSLAIILGIIIPGVNITTLDHKSRNDAMESGSIIIATVG